MKKLKLVILIAIAVVLALAAVAWANTATGQVTGASPAYSTVLIHNYATGARGSTTATSAGYYTFTGLTSGVTYGVASQKCSNHIYYVSSWYQFNGSSGVAPNLPQYQVGSC